MKKKMSMRFRVLITILPIAVLPILIIAFITVELIRERMLTQSKVFYANILSQVHTNIDFFYNQNAMIISDITQTESFERIADFPHASNFAEQRQVREREDRLSVHGRVRANITAKTKGDFFLIELDRYDYGRNVDFTLNEFSHNDLVLMEKKSFTDSPIFNEMKKRMNMQPIFASASVSGMSGYNIELRPGYFVPYLRDGDKEIKKVTAIIETKDFLKDIYGSITSLMSGTLYIIDMFDNILSYNHPSFDDFYEFDREKKQYILNPGDPLYDPFGNMSFSEYCMLNTCSSILDDINIDQIIHDNIEQEESVKSVLITHNGIDYLSFFAVSSVSGVKLAYFHPVNQILKPITQMIRVMVIVILAVVFSIILISLFISRYFTFPIHDLTDAARFIKSGEYSLKIDLKKYFGEFFELGETFNSMVSKINEYNQNLEGLVKQRTEELDQANESLKISNDELVKINNKNRKDLMMASRIQLSLIPKIFPESNLLEISAMYLPMEALGGDFYDVYKISETKFGILILDVCGHGVPAALITTMAKMSFSTNVKLYTFPDEVMNAANRDLCEAIQGSGDFLTAFYCIVDIEKNSIIYSNAGHNDMIIFHSDSGIENMPTNGPIVGVFEDMKFGCKEIEFKKSDRLILYTDGVVEAMDEEKKLYDTDRLVKVIKDNKSLSAKDFTHMLYNDIMDFKGNTPHNDDIAVLIADFIK